MHIKKRVAIPLTVIALSFILSGCSSQFYEHSHNGKAVISSDVSTSSYEHADSEEEILSLIMKTMQDNSEKCNFSVSSLDLINADSWLKKLNGIEAIHCKYRHVRNGYNIVVNLKYWDNYSIINAYRTGNTEILTSKQLELYNMYISVLSEYTSSNATQWENELAIHDYLVKNIQYVSGSDSIYNAYDTLINGTAVCNGYTECFKTFMDMLGIECVAISGSAGNSLHIWNLVNLDGEWYHVDVTWDDPVNGDGTIEHAYFNITDEAMAKDHVWDSGIYPQALGTCYSYPNVMKLPSIETNEDAVIFLKNQFILMSSDIEFTSTQTLDIKSSIEQCGITVRYSYRIFEFPEYSLYQLKLNYE